MSEKKSVQLRRPNRPPVQMPLDLPPEGAVRAGMPFAPGQLVMTEGEKRDLKAAGWKPGQPIPADLAQRIDTAKKAFLAEESLEAAAEKMANSGRVLKVPAAVNVADLPSDKRAALADSFAEAEKQAEWVRAEADRMSAAAGLPPSVRDAMMAANTKFIDSRTTDASSPLLPPQDPVLPKTPEAPPAQAPETGERAVPEPEFTRDDFLAFYTADFLNSDKVRYLKAYDFMGGRMQLVFRTARMKHAGLVWTQIKADQMSGRLVGIDDFWRLVYEYQMVLGLQEVKVGGATTGIADEVDAVLADPKQYLDEPDGTPLPHLIRTLQEQSPFDSESCWRLVYHTWRKFDGLVKAMEVKMGDESFCRAIGI